jgi:hypothetical protein
MKDVCASDVQRGGESSQRSEFKRGGGVQRGKESRMKLVVRKFQEP